jgi:2-succinyl-5-enolpyruvyl-6-hydroxy-3-cyclohexene-1-carboxylate synthase
MVQALELIAREWGWSVLSFVDERSAGFFALGKAKALNAPVLVSVTSGTAAAELLPAAIEAHATDIPLVLATADRPRSHRGSGSPQSMWQVGLFTQYAPTVVDWQEGEAFPQWQTQWNLRSPVHINLCHDEPLWEKSPVKVPSVSAETQQTTPWPRLSMGIPNFKRPLVLLGALAPDERESVAEFCRWYQAPVLAEASSGLREANMPTLTRSADRVVRRWLKNGEFDGVIRLGGVPSWRLWRDLEKLAAPTVSFGRCQWSGLAGQTMHSGELAPLLREWMNHGEKTPVRSELHQEDEAKHLEREKLLRLYPQSEPALVRAISERIPNGCVMYLGNSRPIRDWNEQASLSKHFHIQENRGLNGIDGQISSFYGGCRHSEENWALLGDLTTLYDMQGPWALRYLAANTRTRLVVMNNGGGQIFSRMFPSDGFLNTHSMSFKALADLWKMSYSQSLNQVEGQHALIELSPDSKQTLAFREQWEKL